MTTYFNCDKPADATGPIICKICGNRYAIEFDGIKAPYKEFGVLTCACGVDLVHWNSTHEHYLKRIENNLC